MRARRRASASAVPVAVCGEMAGDVALTRLLLGFGLREFSMHPANLLTIKQQILNSELGDLAKFSNRILRTDDPEIAKRLLEKLNV